MRSQPNRDYRSNDVVMTPPALARAIVQHFRPWGNALEPAAGTGNFVRALRRFNDGNLRRVDWCEIARGRDFMEWRKPADWIITNPPWSKARDFLRHSMALATDVVFLISVNHLWTKARVRDAQQASFVLEEIALVDPYPEAFPPSGFSLGAVHWRFQQVPPCHVQQVKLSTLRWRP